MLDKPEQKHQFSFGQKKEDSENSRPPCNMLQVLSTQIIRSFNDSDKYAITPDGPLQTLRLVAKHMHIGRQEDAHEYLRYVLDSMHKRLLWEAKLDGKITEIKKECLHVKSTTRIHRIFGGYTRSRITCGQCKHMSDCFEPCLDIQLDLKNSNHIRTSLAKFCKLEYLQGDNQYRCDSCHRKVNATKQMSIARAPQILTLQLKRFDLMNMSMFSNKIRTKIDYQQVLDISQYMSEEHKCQEMKYELYGVLVHSGFSCNSGHYYSYCKIPKGKWYCFNDSNVSPSSIHQVLNQEEAYLLFYNKITNDTKNQEKSPVTSPTVNANQPTFPLKAKIENERKLREQKEKEKSAEMPSKMRPAFIGPAAPKQQAKVHSSPPSSLKVDAAPVIGPQLPPKSVKSPNNQKPVQGPIQGPVKPPTLSSLSSKSPKITTAQSPKSIAANDAQKLNPEKSSNNPKSKQLVQYDNSSTSSTDSNDSRKSNSKRDEFLKKKQIRLNKLGPIEGENSSSKSSKQLTPVKNSFKTATQSPGITRPFGSMNVTSKIDKLKK